MRRRIVVTALAAVIACGTTGATDLPGSRTSPVEIADEPMHRARLVNASVRVYDVVVPAGEATLFHTHRSSAVGIDMTATRLDIDRVDTPPQSFDTVIGDVWSADTVDGYTHRVANLGEIPYRAIFVEQVTDRHAISRSSVAPPPDRCEIALENAQFRVCRLAVSPGAAARDLRIAPRTVIVTPSGGRLEWQTDREVPERKSWAPGHVAWFEASRRLSFRNVGGGNFVAIFVELK